MVNYDQHLVTHLSMERQAILAAENNKTFRRVCLSISDGDIKYQIEYIYLITILCL